MDSGTRGALGLDQRDWVWISAAVIRLATRRSAQRRGDPPTAAVIRLAAVYVERNTSRAHASGPNDGGAMSEPTSTETQPTGGAVQELARDDVERKKFLRMAGKTMGAGAAATGLAAFIAACGGSSKSSASSSSSGAAASTGTASQPTTTTASSSGDPSSSGDLGIVNYALTLEYLE